MPDAAPVSAVIPAWNAEKFLPEAVRSVQAQSLPVSEIIVVDDGSDDRTAAVAGELGVRLLRQTHQGVAAARNAGIRAAGQGWIAFLDADDIWEPEKIEQQWNALQKHPSAGMVSCDLCIVENGEVLSPSSLDPRNPDLDVLYFPQIPHDFLACQMNYLPSGVLVRREAILSVGLFDESLHYNEDFECFLRVLARRPLVMVMRPLVRHRRHAGNASRNTLKMALSYSDVVRRMRRDPERYPPGAALACRKESLEMLSCTGRAFAIQGRHREARRLLARRLREQFDFHLFVWWSFTWLSPRMLQKVIHLRCAPGAS